MTIEEIIKAVENSVVDEKKILQFEERLRSSEMVFEEKSRKKIVDEEFLSRSYSL